MDPSFFKDHADSSACAPMTEEKFNAFIVEAQNLISEFEGVIYLSNMATAVDDSTP